MNAKQTTRIFTYGTLLTGQANHRLLADSIRVGAARTKPDFTLLDLGAFPGMVAGGETAVKGEIYEVDGDTLAALDRLEGHPRFYRRQSIRLQNGEDILTYIFQQHQPDCPVITDGDWRGVKGA